MTGERQFEDSTKCPLCSGDNECAIAEGRSVESCWCMSASIDPSVVASIPAEAQGKVCICARCAGTEH